MGKKDKNKEKEKETDMQETQDIIDGEISEAGDDVALIKKQNEELVDKLQRNLAEFDNFRKRTIKEKSEMYDIGVVSAVEKLLPIVDNFERALQSVPDKEDNMYKGVAMIYKQLETALKDLNITAIECVEQPFDPNFHNAVAHEQNDEFEQNTVILEMQKGYKYKDKVIRPSMVKVAN